LADRESYMFPAGRNTQKYHHKQVEALNFRLKNHLKQRIFDKNL
jgi:hypothetical protein